MNAMFHELAPASYHFSCVLFVVLLVFVVYSLGSVLSTKRDLMLLLVLLQRKSTRHRRGSKSLCDLQELNALVRVIQRERDQSLNETMQPAKAFLL